VAQPTNETRAGILPEMELNPLTNPLLVAHMGRWAEVYFTTPPEKRAQAVSDLVRELSNDSPSSPVASTSVSREALWPNDEDDADEVSSPGAAAAEQPMILCESCGNENAAPQRFCGMCGVPLPSSSEPLQPFEEAEPIAPTHWNEVTARRVDVLEHEPGSATTIVPVPDRYASRNPPWPPPENNPAEFSMLTDYQSEPARHPYRIYVGLFVAVLLVLLVYATWRNNSAFWSSGTAPSALPQAVPAAKSETPTLAEPPAATSAPANGKASDPAPNAPLGSAATSPNRAAASPGNDRGIERRSSPPPAKSRAVLPAAAESASPAVAAPEQSGSEELSLAEKYLNGGPGAARDSRQAAMLLWKAVAKQNLTATLLLSDLYLRGDGVSKSCDQARLLLDAAARKGAAAAAERLRNIQAFGCR
jgi:hypothetical protein